MDDTKKRCFVISPIGLEGSDVRRRADKILRYIVKPVCEKLGFIATRADEIAHTSLISRRVMGEILTSDLVIADLTGLNPNVYYELAVRHFIGKPVVQLIESSDQLPFDVSDVNTIHFDHTDLDSVDNAKRKLESFILATDSTSECYNPISIVLESLRIYVMEEEQETMTLSESFEKITNQIIGELRDSKRERELLWNKIFDTPSKQNKVQVSCDTDLSGMWDTNYGKAKLLQDGTQITGKYQYDWADWVGEINGRMIGNRVVFEFQWNHSRPVRGVGYLDYTNDQLKGLWYYRDEVYYSLAQLVEVPEFFDTSAIELTTNEDRHWLFKRTDN